MTQNTYTRIQFQNAIELRDQQTQERADLREMLTPFTVAPGTEIYDVHIRRSTEPDQVIVTLGLIGGYLQQREMPDRPYTYELAQAYAANAHNKRIGGLGMAL